MIVVRTLVIAAFVQASTAYCADPVAPGKPAAQLQDLAVFERDFLGVDNSYPAAARAEAARRIAALKDRAGSMTDAQFVLALARIAALADNGHTLLLHGNAPPRVGIRLAPFGEDFFVLRATTAQAALLGGRLVAIDDVPIARLLGEARKLRGGTDAWRDRAAPLFLESTALLHAAGLIGSPEAAAYRVQLPDGSTREATLTRLAEPASDDFSQIAALDPAPTSGWTSLLAADRAPWSLQAFTTPYRRRDAPELDAIVIQLRTSRDADGQSIAKFLEESDAARRRANRRHVILDMRFNGGGNLQLTRDFMSSLPSRLPADGQIIVLTSPWTFSAGIASVGYLKQAGGDHVTLIGEAPGGRMRFWAEGRPATLPNSKALVFVATERHDYLTGCKPFSDCHRPVSRYPIAVRSLAPDVEVPWTIESFEAGSDPAMEVAARALLAC